jgi:choice-of-anchor B domain-containing protein
MKYYPLLIALLVASCAVEPVSDEPQEPDLTTPTPDPPLVTEQGAIPCENGMAGAYPCSGYDLLSNISIQSFGSEAGNDNWGWTDPETGKEYVLAGLDDGTVFVDISDPENPVILGKLPTASESSWWHDIKVYKDHAFIVSEAHNHGLQVFDLTRLREVTSAQTFTEDARLSAFGNAHNIWINESSGYAYVIGSELFQGGPAFINISNPKNPILEGGYEKDSYSHDVQVVNYNGPDSQFHDREILFGSNSDGGENNQIIIVDVTDKANPEKISSITYSNGGYTHQGFLTEDHEYFFLGDELDELRYGGPTQTRIFDLKSLSNPIIHLNYFWGVSAIDHNGYVKGDKFYLANYTAGLRVLDISEVANKKITEKGFFDTYPTDNIAKFNGVWNVYPFFESGVIAIHDIDNGLFLVKAAE